MNRLTDVELAVKFVFLERNTGESEGSESLFTGRVSSASVFVAYSVCCGVLGLFVMKDASPNLRDLVDVLNSEPSLFGVLDLFIAENAERGMLLTSNMWRMKSLVLVTQWA